MNHAMTISRKSRCPECQHRQHTSLRLSFDYAEGRLRGETETVCDNCQCRYRFKGHMTFQSQKLK